MILLDSDVLVLDLRYGRDPRVPVNRQALQQLVSDRVSLGISTAALLEVVGTLSFNVPAAHIPLLPERVMVPYGLLAIPDEQQYPQFANCTVREVVAQMGHRMSFGDAVQAVQIARFAASAECLLTWNAKHFQGKLVIPVLTPGEWLNRRLSGTP